MTHANSSALANQPTYYRSDGASFHLQIERGLLVVVEATSGAFFAASFNEEQVNRQTILNFFEHAKVFHQDSGKNLFVKTIGLKKGIVVARRILRSVDLRISKEEVRDCSFEVYYKRALGRIRISKVSSSLKIVRPKPVSNEAPIKILIVDDSLTIRKMLNQIVSSDKRLEVVGMVERPKEVFDIIAKKQPDVITLDIHMPEMNGVELLKAILPTYNIPTIMISSISKDEGPLVLESLEVGAFDYIQKPSIYDLNEVAPVIVDKIIAASRSSKKTQKTARQTSKSEPLAINEKSLIVIGSSTGGTEALKVLLTSLPKKIPPILIVQHMPEVFTAAFANRLNQLCPFLVSEARDGDQIKPGHVLIAPGGYHMMLEMRSGTLSVRIERSEPVNHHMPSVDVLFNSVAKYKLADPVLGVILTGMGKDGARGLLELRECGAVTVAQDEASSVVYGMPKEAVEIGAAMHSCHISDMAAFFARLL